MKRTVPRRYERHRKGAVSKTARTRNRKRPNFFLLFSLFIISAAISCAASFTLQTPQLNVKEVRIKGVHLADRQVVETIAKSCLGKNVILVKKNHIISEISRLSQVESVKMGRILPNGVWIRVFERRADAVLTNGKTCCLIQNNGYMFHIINIPDKRLPVINVAKCDTIEPGIKAVAPSVKYALEVLDAARRESLKLDKISVDHGCDICLNMGSGFYVKLGQPDEIKWKLSQLKRALTYKPSLANEALYIDVSCPSASVVWMPKEAARTGG